MEEKELSGVVTSLIGNVIYFKTSSAANYRAETGTARLARKNGADMNFDEIQAGDRVKIKGKIWPDNSINASFVRDMSLYAHNSAFAGKITGLSPRNLSFTMESRRYKTQTIVTDRYTKFLKNNVPASFADIVLGMTANVKGTWERANLIVAASEVSLKQRLLNITVSGELKMVSLAAFTLAGDNNVIYGVDITGAKLLGKNNKPLPQNKFLNGHRVRVTGKHAAENVQITAQTIKNLSV